MSAPTPSEPDHWLDWRTPGEKLAESLAVPLVGSAPVPWSGMTCEDIHPGRSPRGAEVCLCCHQTELQPLLDMVGLVYPDRKPEGPPLDVQAFADDVASEPVVYHLPAKPGGLSGGKGGVSKWVWSGPNRKGHRKLVPVRSPGSSR